MPSVIDMPPLPEPTSGREVRKNERRRRTNVLAFRVSDAELQTIEQLAADTGLTVSEYLRRASTEKVERQVCELCHRPIKDADYRHRRTTNESWDGRVLVTALYAHESCFQDLMAR